MQLRRQSQSRLLTAVCTSAKAPLMSDIVVVRKRDIFHLCFSHTTSPIFEHLYYDGRSVVPNQHIPLPFYEVRRHFLPPSFLSPLCIKGEGWRATVEGGGLAHLHYLTGTGGGQHTLYYYLLRTPAEHKRRSAVKHFCMVQRLCLEMLGSVPL